MPPQSDQTSGASRSRRKQALRQQLRERRRALPGELREQAAANCAAALCSWPPWEQLRRIAVYLANDGEMDTALICAAARDAGKTLFLPVVRDERMHFAAWERGATLLANRYGIDEPPWPPRVTRDRSGLELVLMPLVGWGPRGERLGMGGGFYDRALAGTDQRAALRVGLAYDCQRLADAEVSGLCDDWDLPLDAVVTESGVREFSSRRARSA